MEKGKGMPQLNRSLAVGKSARPVAVAICVTVALIAYGFAFLGKGACLEICLQQSIQILGQTQTFIGRSYQGGRMNLRIKSGFYMHCIRYS